MQLLDTSTDGFKTIMTCAKRYPKLGISNDSVTSPPARPPSSSNTWGNRSFKYHTDFTDLTDIISLDVNVFCGFRGFCVPLSLYGLNRINQIICSTKYNPLNPRKSVELDNSQIRDKKNRDPPAIPLSRGIEGVLVSEGVLFRRLPVLIE